MHLQVDDAVALLDTACHASGTVRHHSAAFAPDDKVRGARHRVQTTPSVSVVEVQAGERVPDEHLACTERGHSSRFVQREAARVTELPHNDRPHRR